MSRDACTDASILADQIILAVDAFVICAMVGVVAWTIVIGDALSAACGSLLLGLMLAGSAARLGRYLRAR